MPGSGSKDAVGAVEVEKLAWGPRIAREGRTTRELTRGADRKIATFDEPASYTTECGEARVGGEAWRLRIDADRRASAVQVVGAQGGAAAPGDAAAPEGKAAPGGGEQLPPSAARGFAAEADPAQSKATFARAGRIAVDLAGRPVTCVNERKTDWVIVDAQDRKLGQFTGAAGGVRHVVVDLEPDAELDDAEAAFLAWVARLALESGMVSRTWVLTLSLLVLTPLILLLLLL